MSDGTREGSRRRRRARTPEGIPFATIERLVAHLHGLDIEDNTALRARLHSLRRLNFPDGVAAGSGRHFAYGAADVIGLAFAFELIEAHVPPSAAVGIVRAGWPEIALAAIDGTATRSEPDRVSVHPHALRSSLGPTTPTAALPHVEIESLTSSPAPGPVISIDAGALLQRTLRGLASIDARSHAIMEGELHTLASRFGRGRPLERGSATPGRLGGDGPYWHRAAVLIDGLREGHLPSDERQLRWLLDYLLKPAPVDAWKMRVEVTPDVGFAAALAWSCKAAGLTASRISVSADELEQVGERLQSAGVARRATAPLLLEIVSAARRGERVSRAGDH